MTKNKLYSLLWLLNSCAFINEVIKHYECTVIHLCTIDTVFVKNVAKKHLQVIFLCSHFSLWMLNVVWDMAQRVMTMAMLFFWVLLFKLNYVIQCKLRACRCFVDAFTFEFASLTSIVLPQIWLICVCMRHLLLCPEPIIKHYIQL